VLVSINAFLESGNGCESSNRLVLENLSAGTLLDLQQNVRGARRAVMQGYGRGVSARPLSRITGQIASPRCLLDENIVDGG